MIKVFLVEDEVIIRSGIKNGIDWKAHGYEFVGEASDGELAWPSIKELRPDILITDIRMPFMDGLELSSLAKREIPDMKIIILSGHNEFDYAKQAISIGVTEYLLKPVSSKQLMEAIDRVAAVIQKEQEEKQLLERYMKDMQENKERDKYKLFNSLMEGSISMSEALEQSNKLGIDLGAEGYCVMLFKVATTEHRMPYTDYIVEIQQRIEEAAENSEKVLWSRRGIEGWTFIVQGMKGSDLEERCSKLIDTMKTIAESYTQVEYFGGIGGQVDRLSMLKNSYKEAGAAFANRFIIDMNQIVTHEQMQTLHCQENIKFQGLGSIGENRKALEKFLRSGTEEEVESFMSVYFDALCESDLKSMMLRQYIVMDAFISIISFGESLKIEKKELETEIGEMNEVPKYIQSITATRGYLETLIRKIIMLRNKISGRRYFDIIESAKQFISEHYMEEEISLNTVAATVNMSPSYFSTVFSQETGQTFVEYLTGVRMDKAKELLMCSNMRTSDIGYEVGYKDLHYFSYIFKKNQGCSPKEYRSRREI